MGGEVFCSEAQEKWTLGKEKTASLKAVHYPNLVDAANGPSAGVLSAYSPSSEQGAGVIVVPAAKVRWSTAGLSVTYGTVADMTLTQKISIAEEPDENSQITTIITGKYMRTIDLTVTAIGARPAVETILEIAGAPAHAAGYKIVKSELVGKKGAKKAYQLSAVWLPCFGN